MFGKPVEIVSPSIRKSAAFEKCTVREPGHCNNDSSKVILAHLDSPFKGMGNKSPDIFGVYCCSGCHHALDNLKIVSPADQLRALQETQMILVQKGLLKVEGMDV